MTNRNPSKDLNMRWIALVVVLLLAGCATSRTAVIVSGEVEGVRVAAVYEMGGNVK